MCAEAGETQVGSRGEGGAKARLLTLADLDGRTRAAQQVHATINAIEADLGGAEQLAAGERQIVRRAALAGAMCEDLGARWLLGEPIDPAVFATLSNAERRLLETVGLKRRPKNVTPDLRDYLAKHENRTAGLPDAIAGASA
jgi:hypothetical protein